MALEEATINEIKALIFKNRKVEAENILVSEGGLSPTEAKKYIERLTDVLPQAVTENINAHNNKKLAFILVGIGLLLLGIAVYFFIEKNNQIASSQLATGVVVGFVVHDGAAPIIDYEIEGVSYQYTSNVYAAPPDYELDETIEIYVDNDNPKDVIINSYANKWLVVTILGIFGCVFGFVGLLLFKVALSNNSAGISFIDIERDRLNPFDD